MNKIDVRKLSGSTREQLRRTVFRMLGRGRSQTEVGTELGINRLTVHRWAKAFAAQGEAAFQDGQRGRPTGSGRLLSEQQEARIRQELVDRTPDQLKLKFALWSAQAVRALIKQLFLVDMPVRTVRKYLGRWGFTPQRPIRRAYEQRPEAVEKWLKAQYQEIVRRAKSEGAEISWGDETAASSVAHYPRGYAQRGKTPVLVRSQAKRTRINLVSAVTNQGKLRFMRYRDTLDGQMFIRSGPSHSTGILHLRVAKTVFSDRRVMRSSC